MLALLLTGLVALAEPAVKGDTSVLMMPIQHRGGVDKDLAEQITSWLAAQGARVPGYRVIAFREVEGVMGQEQARQVSGCDQLSCAAEIAGSLNTDEIVIGSLGLVGDSYLLTLTRIRSRDAAVAGRVAERFSGAKSNELLDRMPAVVETLFGAAPSSPTAMKDEPSKGVPGGVLWTMRGVGAAALLTGALVLLLGGAGTAVGLGIFAYDAATGSPQEHKVPQMAGVFSNISVVGGLVLVPLALLLGAAGGAAALITLVLP